MKNQDNVLFGWERLIGLHFSLKSLKCRKTKWIDRQTNHHHLCFIVVIQAKVDLVLWSHKHIQAKSDHTATLPLAIKDFKHPDNGAVEITSPPQDDFFLSSLPVSLLGAIVRKLCV